MPSCQISPLRLSCDFAADPLGIDNPHPRLSWQLSSRERGQVQSAYRIIVGSSKDAALAGQADVWDTGRVESSDQLSIEYQGPELKSFGKYWWAVMVWDSQGAPSRWSDPASWEMGVLNPGDWKGDWIAAPDSIVWGPLFRTEFDADGPIESARAYICGLGCCELYINGSKAGDSVFDPAQTDYEHRAFYVCHDITALLKQGRNACGVMLGNGWFNQDRVWGGLSYGTPRLLAMLRLVRADGTVLVVSSGQDWKCSAGPVLKNNVYAGEVYDARREIPGWAEPGLDDSAWEEVCVAEAPTPCLQAQPLQPIRRMGELQPVEITSPEPRVYLYDLGQNFSGWARIHVDNAPRGAAITLRFAEALDDRGRLSTGSTGVQHTGVVQTDTYICRGGGVEVYEPRFTYHGFRYVEVTRYAGEPTVDELDGVFVHTAVERRGEFESSDPMLNRIHEAAVWTQLSNLHGIPTDCPHRERCGWLGDAQVAAEMSIYNFDMARLWAKYLGDIETTSRSGGPKMISPGKRIPGDATPDWGTAVVQLPWYLYLYYADIQTLKTCYPGMERWLAHLGDIAEGHIVSAGLGDWCAPDALAGYTPIPLTSTGYYYFDARIMEAASRALGRESDSRRYGALADGIREAFVSKFWDSETCSYGSQTGNAFALYLGLVPDGFEQAAADAIARDVVEAHGGHHNTGITGSRHLYWALSEYGHGDVALGMLRKRDYPSFGQLFDLGATSMWENWGEKWIDEQEGERSQSHPMQGGFDAWFYSGLAGINPSPEHPGFRHILLRPQVAGDLEFVRARYESVVGPIVSSWRVEGDAFEWQIEVPANATADVFVPCPDAAAITESGSPALDAPGLSFARAEGGCAIFRAGGGQYTFRCPAPVRQQRVTMG